MCPVSLWIKNTEGTLWGALRFHETCSIFFADGQVNTLGADFLAKSINKGVEFRLSKVTVFAVPNCHKILILLLLADKQSIGDFHCGGQE